MTVPAGVGDLAYRLDTPVGEINEIDFIYDMGDSDDAERIDAITGDLKLY